MIIDSQLRVVFSFYKRGQLHYNISTVLTHLDRSDSGSEASWLTAGRTECTIYKPVRNYLVTLCPNLLTPQLLVPKPSLVYIGRRDLLLIKFFILEHLFRSYDEVKLSPDTALCNWYRWSACFCGWLWFKACTCTFGQCHVKTDYTTVDTCIFHFVPSL